MAKKIFFSKIICIFFLIFFNGILLSEPDSLRSSKSFDIVCGVQTFRDFDELNESLKTKGIGQIKNDTFLYGLSYQSCFKKRFIYIISLYSNSLVSSYQSGDSLSAKFGFIQFSFSLGYQVYRGSNTQFFSYFGTGINEDYISIKPNFLQAVSWEKSLNEMTNIQEVQRRKFLVKVGIKGEYSIPIANKSKEIILGIDIGFILYPIKTQKDRVSGVIDTSIGVNNFPNLYNQSYFLNFFIGINSKS